jgi:hypothetical protein
MLPPGAKRQVPVVFRRSSIVHRARKSTLKLEQVDVDYDNISTVLSIIKYIIHPLNGWNVN